MRAVAQGAQLDFPGAGRLGDHRLAQSVVRNSAEHHAATRWLVLRLTDDVIEDLSRQVDAHRAAIAAEGDEGGADREPRSHEVGDLPLQSVQSAEIIRVRSDEAPGRDGLGTP